MVFNRKKAIENAKKEDDINTNVYLDDNNIGADLVLNVISNRANYNIRDYKIIDKLIDKEILDDCSILRLENEYELYSRLAALSDRLINRLKYKLLKNKVIIGVGGQFSAGKSAFLNVIIGEKSNDKIELPTSISPSTAVPTYIVNGKKSEILLSNIYGGEISIDNAALLAISHAFKEKYGLGLAQYISFIGITIPGFFENIALLDTPGYSKSDNNIKDKFTDENKAKAQLRLVDYLIWLVDVQNGTLQNEDITFIKNLNLKNKILILVSKCDLKDYDSIVAIIEQVKKDANNNGINFYDVVPFSTDKDSCYYESGVSCVEKFFSEACMFNESVEDIQLQLNSIIKELKRIIDKEIKIIKKERDIIGDIIFKSNDIMKILSFIKIYGEYNEKLTLLNLKSKDLIKVENEIHSRLSWFL